MNHPIAQLANLQARINGYVNGWGNPRSLNERFDNVFHADKTTICIFGSSIIDHLENEFIRPNPMEKQGINLQLNIPGVYVYWRGVSGLTLSRLQDDVQHGRRSPNGMFALNYAKNTIHSDIGIFLWGGMMLIMVKSLKIFCITV